MPFCRNCGAPVDPGAQFCSACGAKQAIQQGTGTTPSYSDPVKIQQLKQQLKAAQKMEAQAKKEQREHDRCVDNIRQAEREINELSRRCANYLKEEQKLHEKISALRERIARSDANSYFRSSNECELRNYERELNRVIERHMQCEKNQQSARERMKSWQKSYDNTSQAQQKKQQQREPVTIPGWKQPTQNKPKKSKAPKIIIAILILLVLAKVLSDIDNADSRYNGSVPQEAMSNYIGYKVEQIEELYGSNYSTGDGNLGGPCIYYKNAAVPYAFYCGEIKENENYLQNEVIAVESWQAGTEIVKGVCIGDSVEKLEEVLGTPVMFDVEDGSDYYDAEGNPVLMGVCIFADNINGESVEKGLVVFSNQDKSSIAGAGVGLWENNNE